MKKSKLLPLINLLLCSAILLSACSSTKPITTNSNEKNLKGSIRIYADENDTKYLNTAINSFKTKYNNTSIEITTLNEEEIVNKYIENYGKDVQGDIVILKEEKIREVLSKYEDNFLSLYLDRIDDKLNLIEDKYNNLAIGNSQYGVPWYVNPVGIIYRKDILTSVNLNAEGIKTWQDYISAGDVLNVAKLPKLLSVNGNNMNYISLSMMQQLASNFTSEGNIVINSDKVLKVGSTIKTLIEKDIALQTSNDSEAIDQFINGKTASIIATSTDLKKIEENAPNLKDKLQFEKIPAFENGGNRDTTIRGSGILINNESKNEDLALAFMNYLASDYNSMKELYDKYKLIPAHYIIYTSADFSAGDDYYGSKVFDEEIEIVKKSFNYSYPSDYEVARKVFINSIKSSIASKEEMKLTLDKLQNNINDAIANASVKN